MTSVLVETAGSTRPWRRRLSRAQKAYITEYVDYLTSVLRLEDWVVDVNLSGPSDIPDTLAQNGQYGHSRHCELVLSDEFFDLDADSATQVLVHELMHCHLFEVHSYASEAVAASCSGKASSLFELAMVAQVEFATDALADVVLPLVEVFDMPAFPVVKSAARKASKREH